MNIENSSGTKTTRPHQSPQSQQIDTFQHGNKSIYQDFNDLIERAVFQTVIFSMKTTKHILIVLVSVNNRVIKLIHVKGSIYL